MMRKVSIEQFLARDQHEEWQTARGRVLDEIQRTIYSMANGEIPNTVLGGLVREKGYSRYATCEEDARTIGWIAAVANISPVERNHRGDTIRDVLDDLIEVGWVRTVELPSDTLEGLLSHTSDEPRLMHYYLVEPNEADALIPRA